MKCKNDFLSCNCILFLRVVTRAALFMGGLGACYTARWVTQGDQVHGEAGGCGVLPFP